MSDYIDVSWEVDDGYTGKSRPQSTRIYIEEIDHCTTEQEVENAINEAIEEDFRQSVSWCYRG